MAGDVISELNLGVLPAADVRDRLGVSPATFMRMVREAGPEILRIGRGRATQYGLRQVWPNLDSSRFPLFRIRESGTAGARGGLITLTAHQTAWMPIAMVVGGPSAPMGCAVPSCFFGRPFAAAH